jgi:hypothetical protein
MAAVIAWTEVYGNTEFGVRGHGRAFKRDDMLHHTKGGDVSPHL